MSDHEKFKQAKDPFMRPSVFLGGALLNRPAIVLAVLRELKLQPAELVHDELSVIFRVAELSDSDVDRDDLHSLIWASLIANRAKRGADAMPPLFADKEMMLVAAAAYDGMAADALRERVRNFVGQLRGERPPMVLEMDIDWSKFDI